MFKRLLSIICACMSFSGMALAVSTDFVQRITTPSQGNQYFPLVDKVSLEELVDFALVESPIVAQGQMQTEIAKSIIDEVKSAWLPRVALNTGAGWDGGESNKNYGLSVNQLLYDFGQTDYKIDAATHNHLSNQYQQLVNSKAIVHQIISYYIEIKRYESLIQAINQNIHSLENLHKTALLRSDAGVTTKSDVLQIQSRMSSMKTLLVQYKTNLDGFKMRATVLSGVSANSYKAINLTKFDISKTRPINFANLPEIAVAEARVAIAKNDLKSAERSQLPTVNMSLGLNREYEGSNADWDKQVNVNLNYPIYQGGALTAQIKQASIRVSVAQQEMQQVKLDIIQSSQLSLRDFDNAKQLINESERQNMTAQRAKDIYQDEYLLGKRSLSDLLSIEQDLIQSIQSKINAHSDGLVAAVNYLSITGELVEKVKNDSQY